MVLQRKSNEEVHKSVKFVQAMGKLKQKMKERGIAHAWTHCPLCKTGRVDAVLAPRGFREPHIHARCDNAACGMGLME